LAKSLIAVQMGLGSREFSFDALSRGEPDPLRRKAPGDGSTTPRLDFI